MNTRKNNQLTIKCLLISMVFGLITILFAARVAAMPCSPDGTKLVGSINFGMKHPSIQGDIDYTPKARTPRTWFWWDVPLPAHWALWGGDMALEPLAPFPIKFTFDGKLYFQYVLSAPNTVAVNVAINGHSYITNRRLPSTIKAYLIPPSQFQDGKNEVVITRAPHKLESMQSMIYFYSVSVGRNSPINTGKSKI